MCRLGDVVFKDGRDVFLFTPQSATRFKSDSNRCFVRSPATALLRIRGTYLWEISLGIANHQTGLSAPSIPNHHKLLRIRGRLRDVGSVRTTRGRAHGCADGTVTRSNALAADRFAMGRQRSRRGGFFTESRGMAADVAVGLFLVAKLRFLVRIGGHNCVDPVNNGSRNEKPLFVSTGEKE